MGAKLKAYAIILISLFANTFPVGCQFDQTGVDLGPGPGPGPGLEVDAGNEIDAAVLVDAAAGLEPDANADAGPCPGGFAVVLRVSQAPLQPEPGDSAVEDALVGDLLQLSAADSCADDGITSIQWTITPDDFAIVSGGINEDVIEIYPTAVTDYRIEVSLANGRGQRLSREAPLVTVHGWQLAAEVPGGDIRDLANSDDALWIAGKNGAFRLSLQQASAPVSDINDDPDFGGDSIPDNLAAVFYHPSENHVWFGRNSDAAGVWRIELGQSPATRSLIPYDTEVAIGQSSKVDDIGLAAPGVAVATDHGLTFAFDSANFVGRTKPDGDTVRAVTATGGQRWAGDKRLYNIFLTSIEVIDPFSGADRDDNKIRVLSIDPDDNSLWIGSAELGIAHQREDGRILAVYDQADGLPADNIRAIAIEPNGPYAGDVWVATNDGIGRFLRRANLWLIHNQEHGLEGHLDVKAIAIDTADGRRAIYAGTVAGLMRTAIP